MATVYERELEHLILNVLLPVYEKAERANGNLYPYSVIDARLLEQMKSKKKVAALLRPKETH